MSGDNSLTFKGYNADERDELVAILETYEGWQVSARRYWDWSRLGLFWAIDVEGVTDEQGKLIVLHLIEKMHSRGD